MPNQLNNEILVEEIPSKKETPSSKGLILKKAREAQGFTLESIHESTKIPLDVLRAIEEGYTVRIISPFYYRGFVKMYAQYLNMNVGEVLGAEVQEKEALPKYPSPVKESWEFEQWFVHFFTKARKRQFFISLSVLAGIIFTWKAITFATSHWPSKPAKKEIVRQREQKGEKSKRSSAQEIKKIASEAVEKKMISPFSTALTSSASQPVTNISLTLRARKNSWLNVKADGQTVFQGTLNVGDVETWKANDKIEISGKNLNQLEFELNGRMIGTLGRADRKAKMVIIAKDGLKVVK